MPILNGIDATRQIRKEWHDAKILFLTMHANLMYLKEAMRAGGSGYVLKSSAVEELPPAIRNVLKGRVYIHKRRSCPRRLGDPPGSLLLQLVAKGRTNGEIATVLDVSIKTVQFRRGQLRRKLGVNSAVKLAAMAIRDGLVVTD